MEKASKMVQVYLRSRTRIECSIRSCVHGSGIAGILLKKKWLPDMDLNHDKENQNLSCYHYTIGQGSVRLVREQFFLGVVDVYICNGCGRD